MGRVEFFVKLKGGKGGLRSFSLVQGKIDAKSITLMGTIPDFEIVVNEATGETISDLDDFNTYPFRENVKYEIRPKAPKSDTSKLSFICTLSDLKAGRSSSPSTQDVFFSPGRPFPGRIRFGLYGRDLLLCTYKNKISCIDSLCYHFGGPLLEADMEDLGGQSCLICPWHKYPISVETGESILRGDGKSSCIFKGVKQRIHHVEVKDGKIFVKLNIDPSGNEIASDHYASMGFYKLETSKSPAALHSSITNASASTSHAETLNALSPNEFRKGVLIKIRPVSSDTHVFTFQIMGSLMKRLNCPPGYHLTIKWNSLERDYTPIGENDDGTFDLLIKRYPTNGMSQHIHDELQVGDATLLFKGCLSGHFDYVENQYQTLFMLCNGTGITPLYSILREIYINMKRDRTNVQLLYQCRSKEDILLNDEISSMLSVSSNRFKVTYFLSQKNEKIDGKTIDKLVQTNIKPRLDYKILLCGSDGFCDDMVSFMLRNKVDKTRIHQF